MTELLSKPISIKSLGTKKPGQVTSALNLSPELIDPAHYSAVLTSVFGDKKQGEPIEIQRATQALIDHELACFHWELAFPDVFLKPGTVGFDIIIGNPPYDVLAEKEAGPRAGYIKRFVDIDPTLAASKVGKNNLYKLFICRALELLVPGGVSQSHAPNAQSL